jgi:hypothetical protein
MDHYQFLVATERKYAIALAKYEVAEHATETLVGLKAIEDADARIQRERAKLKAEMERIAGTIRRLCDPEWTPDHVRPLHLRKMPNRAGEISKLTYRIMREEKRSLSSWELAHLVGARLGLRDGDGVRRLAYAIHHALDRRTAAGQVIKEPTKPIRWSIKPPEHRASSASATVRPIPAPEAV